MTAGHRYLSTACHHDQHDYCAAPRRPDGTPKQPASCKFCSAPCECVCHTDAASDDPTPTQDAVIAAWARQTASNAPTGPGVPDDPQELQQRLLDAAGVHNDLTTFDAGFKLARQIARDPWFRRHLKSVGWTSGTPIVPAQPGETMGAIRERAHASGGGKVLVATPDSRQPHGWLLVWMDTA